MFYCVEMTLNSLRSGTGAYKLGVNYAPGVLPQKAAAALGYSQNLWLHGPEHYLTEVRFVSSIPCTYGTHNFLRLVR